MKVIKQADLIAESARSGSRIVTRTADSALKIYQEALKQKLSIHYPLTYDDFIRGQYDWRLPGLLIDNLDDLLYALSRAPISAMTMSEDG